MNVWTSRINYKPKNGQLKLNTTIMSGTGIGALFAPTWKMVNYYKEGKITWGEYTRQYYELMRNRYREHTDDILSIMFEPTVVFTCYCKDTHKTTRQCHRYLLVDIFQKIANAHGIDYKYMGEC